MMKILEIISSKTKKVCDIMNLNRFISCRPKYRWNLWRKPQWGYWSIRWGKQRIM